MHLHFPQVRFLKITAKNIKSLPRITVEDYIARRIVLLIESRYFIVPHEEIVFSLAPSCFL